ncbi:CoxG family protein [Tengunoibacter tsumagoiensis]|uniref:Carbon monoxide dehydrogenase subunit G n=1 Tax=Tengunoibacter tsumagoiensis TaxID=2014871 RepID=A0A402A4Y3_9CHLR|nr:SRPBCC domain-containing protein [Tengunoibacter tsumagoiensis]GCE14162.1 hypothetical protein KTT_40210 [Tengunoibacter tsumagoiensis]
MNIEGTYTLQASPGQVWQCLMDQQVLQQIIPGIERIEQVATHCFQVSVQLKNDPFQGLYQGQLTLSELHYPYHYRLTLEGDEEAPIHGTGSIHLNSQEQTTVIAYKGTLQLGKRTLSLKPSIIKGAAKLFLQQLFSGLAAYLQQTYPTEVAKKQATGSILLLSEVATPGVVPPPSIFQKITQSFHLGHGDRELELLWEKRLRRMSMLSGLLFLVWLGTRLPRTR